MVMYVKYKSAKHYNSIPIVDPFISVGNLKLKTFENPPMVGSKDLNKCGCSWREEKYLQIIG